MSGYEDFDYDFDYDVDYHDYSEEPYDSDGFDVDGNYYGDDDPYGIYR